MEKYLAKFNNLSDYITFKNTDMPSINVSYVESLDTVFYNTDGTDKAHKNFYFQVLNPEDIPSNAWITDTDGSEYIEICPMTALFMYMTYSSGGKVLGSDNDRFKLYKDSDYTITILHQQNDGYPGVSGIGADNASVPNTYGLKYKVGGNLHSWYINDGQDIYEFTLPGDHNQFVNLFLGNKYVLDFSDLYIPAKENYIYTNMFDGFNIDSNDTLVMTDFYFNNVEPLGQIAQYNNMFRGLPSNNGMVYLTGEQISGNTLVDAYSGYGGTNTNLRVDFNSYVGNPFERLFIGSTNLTDIVPMDFRNKKIEIYLKIEHTYRGCPKLRDLSGYDFDFTGATIGQDGVTFDGVFYLDNAPSVDEGLTKAPKIRTDEWGKFNLVNIYGNQANLTEIYLLGDNLSNYNPDNLVDLHLNPIGNFPSSGTVYVTDTTVDINTLNAKFGIPTTWTVAIYSA